MNDKVKRILSELRQELERLYGDRLSRLILFGSQARGDAEEWSDIDVLVVLKGHLERRQEKDKLMDKIVQWNLDYQELVSCVYMTEKRFQNEQSPLLINVRREGVPI